MSTVGDALPTPVAVERVVEGLLVPYGEWLEVENSREGHFLETFAPGSLRKSFGFLRRLKGYFDHGRSRLFGSAPVMQLQEAWETDAGAFFRASLLDGIPPFIIDGIKRGLYGASVGGEPIDVEVERFPQRSAFNPRGIEQRVYREVRVHDVSLTASPAYEASQVAMRAHDYVGDSGPVIHRVALAPVVMRSEFLLPPTSRRDYLEPTDYLAEEDWRL
jgi:phage head maturation protease